jgi:parallel beta-helix repeat protein
MLASFTVVHLNDSGSPLGTPQNPEHTLRSAINAANASPNQFGLADVIEFTPGLSGTLNVMNGPMVIRDHVRIFGPSGAVTYNAGNPDQAAAIEFAIVSSNTASSTVSGLRITGFDVGVKVASVPASHNVTISSNQLVLNGHGMEITAGASVFVNNNTIQSNNGTVLANGGFGVWRTWWRNIYLRRNR